MYVYIHVAPAFRVVKREGGSERNKERDSRKDSVREIVEGREIFRPCSILSVKTPNGRAANTLLSHWMFKKIQSCTVERERESWHIDEKVARPLVTLRLIAPAFWPCRPSFKKWSPHQEVFGLYRYMADSQFYTR